MGSVEFSHDPPLKNENCAELTLAKASGNVTTDRGKKNWPIADRRVLNKDQDTIAGHISAPIPLSSKSLLTNQFAFAKKSLWTLIRPSLPPCDHLDDTYRSQARNGLDNTVSYITLHNNYIL